MRFGKLARAAWPPRRSAAEHLRTLATGKEQRMINEGDQAPSLRVQTSSGETVDLADPGRPLVLYFYPKDDTSGCTRQALDFTASARAFEQAGATIVGVSRDP